MRWSDFFKKSNKNHAVEVLNRRLETVVDTGLTQDIIVESKNDNLDAVSSSLVIS